MGNWQSRLQSGASLSGGCTRGSLPCDSSVKGKKGKYYPMEQGGMGPMDMLKQDIGLLKQRIKESFIYLEEVHRFVDHLLTDGRIIRTEKDGGGNVFWYTNPSSKRSRIASKFRHIDWSQDSKREPPTLHEKVVDSTKFTGSYDTYDDNCGDYAIDQCPGERRWRGWYCEIL
mmetsp:Transcript_35411/g.81684  ORF Transcript_35411/g.81684 Transcript_35411/m.81684 type:complete len:172 (+) Transcript_35411:75-590(+)